MAKMTKILLLLASSLSLAATGIEGAHAQSAKGEPILIGVHLDAGKQASYYSVVQRETFDIYVKELNAAGGVNGRPIELVVEDDENNPVVAATKVEKLNSRGVHFIASIGSAATGIGAQSKAQPLRIPHGSAMNQAVSLTHPIKSYYFRIALSFGAGNEALVDFMKKKTRGTPKVAVVRDATETGLLLSDPLIATIRADKGLNLVAVEQVTPGSTDVTAQALRVKATSPDYVILAGGSIPDLANYAKMHNAVGTKGQMLGTYVFATPAFLKLAGQAAEGFIYTDTVDPDRPEVKKIEAILVKEGGDQKFRNNPLPIQAWEFIRLVTDAIKRAKSVDREAIRDALENTRDWPTALGPAGTTVNYSATNHDLFVSGKQVVLRILRNGDVGPAIKW